MTKQEYCTVRSESRFALIKYILDLFSLNHSEQKRNQTMTYLTGIALQPLLKTKYSETAAHCNGNCGTDSQMYVR
jgi:Tfp pilus assembly pilus retraction ATPase PilT